MALFNLFGEEKIHDSRSVMDGLTAVREIKKIDPAARIIMCTALGQQTMVIEAIKAGAIVFPSAEYPLFK